jgi:hypothetical protein
MKRLTLVPLLIGFLVFGGSVASTQDSQHLEKVAEGEYTQWQDGHPLKDTGLTWTVWRTTDGFEVEAKLPLDKGLAILAGMGADPGIKMTPELKKEIQDSSTTTDIDLQMTKEMAIQKMILEGKNLGDFKQVQVADCRVSEKEISCKGREGTVRLKNEGPDQLVYSYPFPVLFTPILKNYKPAENRSTSVKLALLEEGKNKMRLTELPGQLHDEGAEKLTIGQHTLDTEKYSLILETKAGARKITLWTANHETVFAMEDSLLAPGLRILLSHYKRYSEF